MDEPTSYQPGQTIQPGGSDNDQPISPAGSTPRDPNDPAPQPVNDPNQPKPEELEDQPSQPAAPTTPNSSAAPAEASPVDSHLADRQQDPADEQSSQDPDRQDQGGTSAPPPPPTVAEGGDDGSNTVAINQSNLPPLLSWEASEYVEHQRGALWYLGMIGATIVLAGACLILFKEWLSAVVVVLVMVALFVYARKAPRVLHYVLNEAGISIGNKFYSYQEFRSFSLRSEHSFFTIELEPLKRFMPRLSLFSDRDSGDTIADILERFLPRSDRQPDVIDRMSNRLKI